MKNKNSNNSLQDHRFTKHIENKLNTIELKYSQSIADISKLRQEIDIIRRDRVLYDSVFKK